MGGAPNRVEGTCVCKEERRLAGHRTALVSVPWPMQTDHRNPRGRRISPKMMRRFLPNLGNVSLISEHSFLLSLVDGLMNTRGRRSCRYEDRKYGCGNV